MFQLKKWVMTSLFLGLLSVFVMTACEKSRQVQQCQECKKAKQSNKVTFLKGKVIEIAFASVIKGKQKKLGEYFQKAIPIGKEYGAKPLAVLNVVAVPYGDKKPHIIGFFEWPSVQAFLDLHADPRFLKIVKIRTDALSYLSNGHFFTVKNDTTIALKGDKMYELWGAWVKAGKKKTIKKYSKKIASSARRYGQRKLLALRPVRLEKHMSDKVIAACNNRESFVPDLAGFVQWPNTQAYNDFIYDDKFKNAVYLRDEATSRFEMFHAKVPTPPKK